MPAHQVNFIYSFTNNNDAIHQSLHHMILCVECVNVFTKTSKTTRKHPNSSSDRKCLPRAGPGQRVCVVT